MKSPKSQVWKCLITLMILAGWIILEGVATVKESEARSVHRKRDVTVNPNDTHKKDTVDIGKSFVEIAERASQDSVNQAVDLVFVVDGSLTMRDLGKRVERQIVDMARVFEESVIDYQFALIWFQNIGGSQIILQPLQRGLLPIQESFFRLPLAKFKGPVAGYGLDAIMKGLTDLKFRWDAEKHFVVVTNSELQTTWGTGDEKKELFEKILDWCKQDEIRINVIGIDEEIQMQLADRTDGKWYGTKEIRRRVEHVPLVKRSILDIDEIFKRIAQHIAATVKQPTDIVFVFDSSLSMDNKIDEICTGLDSLVKILDSETLDYRLGIIRFWARSGGGESSVVITKPPLSTGQVRQMFRTLGRGDEHLLDAVIEGVPKLQTPEDRKLILFIVTDESSSSGPGKEYTSAKAIVVCRQTGAQVNVIGGIVPVGHGGGFVDEFQRGVTEITNGKCYIMPGAEIQLRDRRNR